MFIKIMKKILGKAPLIAIVTVSIFLLCSSNPVPIVFTEAPAATAVWEIHPFYTNTIGSVIVATLRITTVPGVTLDLTRMPREREILPLPSKIKPAEKQDPNSAPPYNHPGSFYNYGDAESNLIDERKVEVRSRTIRQYLQGDFVITEITYELQYLMPIDFDVPFDDKKMPLFLAVFQNFHKLNKKGQIEPGVESIQFKTGDFYMVRRVDENSKPIMKLYSLTPSATVWTYLRLVGLGLIGLGILSALVPPVRWFIRRRRKSLQPGCPEVPLRPLTLTGFYIRWGQSGDYGTFLEAIKLYRKGTWGRPHASSWLKSTFVLYSGRVLGPEKVAQLFAELIKEVSDEAAA